MPDSEPPASLPAAVELPEQTVSNEKPQFQTSEIPVMEAPPPIAVNSASKVTALLVPEEKAPSPTPVENYEQDPKKSKIRIHIYRELPEEQVIAEPQRDTKLKQIDIDPLLRKLKKFFRATPLQPAQPDEKPSVRILED